MAATSAAVGCVVLATILLVSQVGTSGAAESKLYSPLVPQPKAAAVIDPIIEVANFFTPTPEPTPIQVTKVQTMVVSNTSLWESVVYWFSEQPEKAYRVFMCESGGDPTAVSPDGLHVGVAQQAVLVWGYPPSNIFGQVAKARSIFQMSGWRAWPVCGQR